MHGLAHPLQFAGGLTRAGLPAPHKQKKTQPELRLYTESNRFLRHFYEDNHQREQYQRLDEGQSQNQRELNSPDEPRDSAPFLHRPAAANL